MDVIGGHWSSLEVLFVLDWMDGWDWMVFIGHRYSKSTFVACNVIFFGNEPTSGLL